MGLYIYYVLLWVFLFYTIFNKPHNVVLRAMAFGITVGNLVMTTLMMIEKYA